jgi:lysophospholipase L1-like esterase
MIKKPASIIALIAAAFAPLPGAATAAPSSEHKVRIILVGDSTVTDQAGWGLGFKEFLADGAECINTAVGGRSSRSFIKQGKWERALSLKGDYYLIQFDHNDEPAGRPQTTVAVRQGKPLLLENADVQQF